MKQLVLSVCLLLAMGAASAQTQVLADLVYLVKKATVKSDSAPALVLLHGYGSNEADLFDISASLDPRYTVFSVRAPHAVEAGGYCWYPMQFLPGQKFSYDYAAVKKSRAAVLRFISQACKTFALDSQRVFLMGYSQGTILSYDLALSTPKKIAGVLALSGRLLEETAALSVDWAAVRKQKYFIGHGLSDNVIPHAEAKRVAEVFKSKQLSHVVFNSYEMPHTISGRELNDIKEWLRQALQATKKAPTQKN